MLRTLVDTVLGALLGAVVEHFQLARRDAKLEELGFEKARVARLKAERGVARRAKAIDAEVTPKDVEAILSDL